MRFSTTLFILLKLVLSSHFANAAYISNIPNFNYDLPALSTEDVVLGRACLSLHSTKLGLSCNPASLATEEKTQFRIGLVGDDHFGDAWEYYKLVKADDTFGTVNRLLAQNGPLVTRANTSLWYQKKRWALVFTPARVGFADSVRNTAYPQIGTHVFKETEADAKYGFQFEDSKLDIGIQARFVWRDYLRSEFYLLDALYDPRLIAFKHQRAIYLEPGLTYRLESAWDAQLSATLTNGLIASNGDTDWSSSQPILDLGLSSSPDFTEKKLRTTVHFSTRPEISDISQRLSWAGLYQFEKAALTFSLGSGTYAAGISGHIDSAVLGFAYKSESSYFVTGSSKHYETYNLEFGLTF